MPFGWGSRSKGASTSDDKLTVDDVLATGQLQCDSGIPSTSDSCAYEPIQKLLAIATSDGRVKLLGKQGVEKTLFSASQVPYGTRQLEFVDNRAILYRVSEGGFLETWSLASSKTGKMVEGSVRELSSIKLEGDAVRCAAAMPQDPFLLLGCASGMLRFAALVEPGGAPTADMRQARGLQLLPYRVPADQLKGNGLGELVEVGVRSYGYVHMALLRFQGPGTSGVSVWDIRSQSLRASLNPRAKDAAQPALKRAGRATAVAWLAGSMVGGGLPGQGGADFVTGHELGDILVWQLQGLPVEQVDPANPPPKGASLPPPPPSTLNCVAVLRVVAGGSPAEPLHALRPLRMNRRDAVLALGGQAAEQPLALALVPLPLASSQGSDTPGGEQAQQWDSKRAKLPFFGPPLGFAAVPGPGGISVYEDPAAVVQLLDTGQLAVHELASSSASRAGGVSDALFSTPIQSGGPITVTSVVLVPGSRQEGHPAASACMSALRKVAAALEVSSKKPQAVQAAVRAAKLVLGAGQAPKLPSGEVFGTVFVTGHKDGCVRVWDTYCVQPQLLAVAPTPSTHGTTLPGPSLRAVSALQLVPEHGMLVVGHSRGEVRAYQLWEKGRGVEVVALTEVGATPRKGTQLAEEPGLQLKLRVLVHEAEITCIAYSPAAKCITAGDKTGCVSVTDMTQPVVLWLECPLQQPVVGVALASVALPSKRDRGPGMDGADGGAAEGTPARMLIMVSADSSLAALGPTNGQYAGKGGCVKPRNPCQAITMELLDAHYRPLWLAGSEAGFTQESAWGKDAGGDEAAGTWKKRGKGGAAAGSKGRHHLDSSDDEEDDEEEGSEAEEEDDDEEYLAAAADKVEKDVRKQKAAKMKAVLTLGVMAAKTKRGGGGRSKDPSFLRRKGGGDQSDAEDEGSEEGSDGAGNSGAGEHVAEHVLLVTDQYIRLYKLRGVVLGDRTTTARVSPTTPLIAASVMHVNGAPGLVTLAQSGAGEGVIVQVWSIPGLALLMESPLSDGLGPSLSWDPPEGSIHKVQRLVACSHLGRLMLLGPANELLQMDVVAGVPEPATASGVYDWEVAMAAHAAAVAADRAAFDTRNSKQGPGTPRGGAPAAPSEPATSVNGDNGDDADASKSGLGRGKDLLGGVLSKVQQGMSKALEGTTKGLATVVSQVGVGVKEVGRLLMENGPDAYMTYNMQYPDLLAVLSQDMGPDPAGAGARGKNRKHKANEDGIPVSQAQPLVVSRARPLAAAGNASNRSSASPPVQRGAGGGGAASSRAPAAAASRRHQVQEDESDLSELDMDEEEEAGGRGKHSKGKATTSRAGGGDAGVAGPSSSRGLDAGGGARHRATRQYDDDEEEEAEEGGAKAKLNEARAKLVGGAQALAGHLGRLGVAAADAVKEGVAKVKAFDEEEEEEEEEQQRPGHSGRDRGGEYDGGRRGTHDREGDSRGVRKGGCASDKWQPPEGPKFRSTSEIKNRYNRGGGAGEGSRAGAASHRTSQVRDVVEQTRNALAERGEKIRRLEDKADDLHEGAAGFADLAKQLADAQRGRKWWQ